MMELSPQDSSSNHVVLRVLDTREDMLQALLTSKISNSIIGIKSNVLGPGTYFTSVVDIAIGENNEALITIKGYDMTGYFLDKSRLNITDIESVIPFTALFENPFLRNNRLKPLQINQ